jgi:hypothetical protein
MSMVTAPGAAPAVAVYLVANIAIVWTILA